MSGRALDDFAVRCAHAKSQRFVDAAATEVLDGLAAHSLEHVVLKGAAVSRLLYEPREYRSYVDLDILVSLPSLNAAGSVLSELGYQARDHLGGDADFLGVAHSVDWIREQDGRIVDLHWRFFGVDASPDLVWERLRHETVLMRLLGRTVRVLGPSAFAMHLALHAAQDGMAGGKAFGDLERAVSRWPFQVWNQAAELARELEAIETFAAGLALAPAGTALIRRLGLPAVTETSWMVMHSRSRPRGTFHLIKLAEAPRWRDKAAVMRRALLPSRGRICELRPLACKGPIQLAAAYAEHLIVRAPLWAFRAWRYRYRALRASQSAARSSHTAYEWLSLRARVRDRG